MEPLDCCWFVEDTTVCDARCFLDAEGDDPDDLTVTDTGLEDEEEYCWREGPAGESVEGI